MVVIQNNETFVTFLVWIIIWLSLIFCVYAFYKQFIKPVFYWKIRGVFHVNLYHRFFKVFVSEDSFLDVVRDAYESFPNRRYYGSYQFLRPSLFVKDIDLIKKITVKDFEYFHDHASFTGRNSDLVNQNLFALEGQQWRNMRSTLSPAFTSSKMRHMFGLISKTADNFTTYFLENLTNSKIEIEMKDYYSKYTSDVIATCAFGIECDSLKNQDNEFFRMGKFFSSAFRGFGALRGLINVLFPWAAQVLGIKIFPSFVTEFFQRIVRDTIAHREKEGIIRPDLIHLLMQARKGQLKEDINDSDSAGFASVTEVEGDKETETGKTELTDDIITAQALVFFFAGFDTSSTLLAFLSYELAINPDVQQKLQREIDDSLAQTGGKLDYDAVLKMKYLDQVVSETLRMYPPGFALNRVCTKNYFIPAKQPNEKDLMIEKGCLVAIPVYGIHMCPEYFPNPDRFDPDRFSDENKPNLVPGTYMPFGSGPRNCIGSRFALLETKAMVVNLLAKLNIVPTEKTEIPVKFSKTAVLGPKNGIWLALVKRM